MPCCQTIFISFLQQFNFISYNIGQENYTAFLLAFRLIICIIFIVIIIIFFFAFWSFAGNIYQLLPLGLMSVPVTFPVAMSRIFEWPRLSIWLYASQLDRRFLAEIKVFSVVDENTRPFWQWLPNVESFCEFNRLNKCIICIKYIKRHYFQITLPRSSVPVFLPVVEAVTEAGNLESAHRR